MCEWTSTVVVGATIAQAAGCLAIALREGVLREAAKPRVAHALGAAIATPAVACALLALAPDEWRAGTFIATPLLWWTTLLCSASAVLYLHVGRRAARDTAEHPRVAKSDASDVGATRALNLLFAFGALTAIVAPARKTPHATTTRLVTGAIACALGNHVVLRDARATDGVSMVVLAVAHALGHVACALVLVGIAFEVSRTGDSTDALV